MPPRLRHGLWVLAALVPVVLATLMPDGTSGTQPFQWRICIPCGATGTPSAALNVLLFAPLGAAFVGAGLGTFWTIVASVALAFGIEFAQTAIPGRHPILGDVLMNGAGSMLGAVLLVSARRWLLVSRVTSWIATAGAAITLAGTATLLQPSLSPSVYYAHWTPNQPPLEWYRGTVLSAEIGGLPLPAGRLEAWEAVRGRFLTGGEIQVVALAGPPVSGLGSLFHVSDLNLRRMFLLGPQSDDLVFYYRTVGNVLRFDSPGLRIRHAFAGVPPGDTLRVTALLRGDGACLTLNDATACPATFSIGSGWALVQNPKSLWPPLARWLDLAWLAGLGALIAFWSPSRRSLGQQTLFVAGVMVAAALASPMVAVGPLEFLGLAVGIALGTRVRRLVATRVIAYAAHA